MNQESRCPIWNTPASRESLSHRGEDRGEETIDSPRAGGWYSISVEAITLLPQIDDCVKARLTSWLVDQRRLGVECPKIFQETIKMAKQQENLSVHDRADRLLQYIGDKTVEIGHRVTFTVPDMSNTAIAAWSESVKRHEVETLLEYLADQGWIKSNTERNYHTLTVKGSARLAELKTANTESSKGSVTMSGGLTTLPTEPGKKVLNAESKMRDVFIIHGRDDGTKETVARFISQLGLNPIILHEQPNQGQTIIEKFERHAEVTFAIALLTPDDTGSLSEDEPSLKPRARQNVIFELGYFTGKLGRPRVCALTKGTVEIPSDYYGVLYIPLDESGAWRMKLVQELKNAGFEIDANLAF